MPDNNWRVIADGPYAGLTAMRLHIKYETPGGFSFLRWRDSIVGANSSPALEASLSYPGNISAGFEEAAWPVPPVPGDYPEQPGVLNPGDWVYGSSGYRQSTGLILDEHIRMGYVLTLPIYDGIMGQRFSAQFGVVDLKRFVLLGHGRTVPYQQYLELVLLGPAGTGPTCAPAATPTPTSTSTPTPTPTSTSTPTNTPTTADLAGDVAFRPEYAFIQQLEGGGSTCQARADVLDGNPEWRDTIPPTHFQPVSIYVYPNVGDVILQNADTEEVYSASIIAAAADGRLSYRVPALPAGRYWFLARIFYLHPLDARRDSPRLYSTFEDMAQESVVVPEGGQVQLDVRLRHTGDVCFTP
jgi:hypothetical protein